jgi:hypothetical protein
MGRKLTLDIDRLRVESYATGEAVRAVGTIRANEAPLDALVAVTRTNCLTTPCCPATVSCPTG